VSATAVLLFATTLAAADGTDADGDGVPDTIEDATQRNLVAVSAGDEINISSQLESPPFHDQFGVSFKAGTFRVEYGREGASTSYELELRSLVEWTDQNGNGRIDANETVASSPLGSSAFGGATVTETRTETPDHALVYGFLVRSLNGEVTLNLTVANRFTRLPNTRVLTPMEVKLDITINRVITHAGASVGLDLRIKTDSLLDYRNRSWDDLHGFTRDEAAVNVTAGPANSPATVFFSWSKSALVNGGTSSVMLSSFAGTDPTSHDVYLAFPGPATSSVNLVHESVLGVDSAAYDGIVNRRPEIQGDITLYLVSLTGVAVLVAATIVVVNRGRKKRPE
jgi:hypothetical protein